MKIGIMGCDSVRSPPHIHWGRRLQFVASALAVAMAAGMVQPAMAHEEDALSLQADSSPLVHKARLATARDKNINMALEFASRRRRVPRAREPMGRSERTRRRALDRRPSRQLHR
ncbi:MAG: hypothetical protein ACJ8G7_05760, partial [Rhizobacter sp.]